MKLLFERTATSREASSSYACASASVDLSLFLCC